MKMSKLSSLLTACALFCAGFGNSGTAQEPSPIPEAAPAPPVAAPEAREPVSAPSPEAAETGEGFRSALTQAVIALRQMARADESGLYLPPIRVRKVVNSKEVDVRYTEKEVEVPVYEKYKTMASVGTDSHYGGPGKPTLREVTLLRIKGYEKQKKLIPDRNGAIVKKEKVPVFGPGGPDYLFAGFWAQNALAIYASLQAGVPVADEQFARACKALFDYTEVYSLPDRTWDLAWLAVAAVNLPQSNPDHQKLTQRLVNKLLLGQVAEGPAAGLWGPICVNTTLFAKMVEEEWSLSKKELEPLEEALKKKPDDRRLPQKINEARAAISRYQLQYADVTMAGLKFDRATGAVTIQPNQAVLSRITGDFQEAVAAGWPYNLLKERTADLQSTALVLFALKEAARNRCIAATTAVPKNLKNQPIIAPENSGIIVRRTLAALMKLETSNKALSECNFWLPVDDFDSLQLGNPPGDDKQFVEVQSPVTPMSTAQTYAALENAARLCGPAAGGGPAPAILSQARRAALAVAEKQVTLAATPNPEDRVLFPCDFIYEMQPAFAPAGNPPPAQIPPQQLGLAKLLLSLQHKDGTWLPRPKYPWRHVGRGGSHVEDYETSLLARIDVLARRHFEAVEAKAGAKPQPYDPAARLWREKPFFHRNQSISMKPKVSATAYAILSLVPVARPLTGGDASSVLPIDWPAIEQADQKDAELKATQPAAP
jgi:hypothetical protein